MEMVARWDYITDVANADKEAAAVSRDFGCISVRSVNFALTKKQDNEQEDEDDGGEDENQGVKVVWLSSVLSHLTTLAKKVKEWDDE